MTTDVAFSQVMDQLHDLRGIVERLKEIHNNDVSSLRSEIARLHSKFLSLNDHRQDSFEPAESSRLCCGAVVPVDASTSRERLIHDELDTIPAKTKNPAESKVDGVHTLRQEARTPPITPTDPVASQISKCPPRAPPAMQVQPCIGGSNDDALSLESESQAKQNAELVVLAPTIEDTNSILLHPEQNEARVSTATGGKSYEKVSFGKLQPTGRPMVHRGRGAAKIFTNDPIRLHHGYMKQVCEEEYQFCESVWDASLFVGDEVFSHFTSIFIFSMLVFMIALLIVFNGIVYDDFSHFDAFNEEERSQYMDWRVQGSHLLTYANQVTGTSMVGRVCNEDESLMMSSDQKATVSALYAYLPAEGSGVVDMVLSGPVLCIMALFVWYITIIKEFHNILQLLRALNHIHRSPFGKGTHITHEDVCFHVRSISTTRATYAIALILGRIVMCALLLVSGTGYILHTIDMEDILLNCVALGIILEVDELMFEALAPARVRCFIQNLQPIDVPPWPRVQGADVYATIISFVLVSGLLTINFAGLVPFLDALYDTLDILCGGNTDFLIEADSVGMPYVILGAAYGSDSSVDQLFLSKAVMNAIDLSVEDSVQKGLMMWGGVGWGPTVYYTIGSNLDSIRAKMQKTWFTQMQHIQLWQTAENKQEINPSNGRVEASLRFLREMLGNQSAYCNDLYMVGEFSPVAGASCYELWDDYASTSTRVQALCPIGCGCQTPWYGTLHKGQAGCPLHSVRSKGYQQQLALFPCDNPSGHLNVTIMKWLDKWKFNPELRLHASSSQKEILNDPTNPVFCDVVYNLTFREETMAPVVCPIHFGCKHHNYSYWPTVEPYCPISCKTTTTTTAANTTQAVR